MNLEKILLERTSPKKCFPTYIRSYIIWAINTVTSLIMTHEMVFLADKIRPIINFAVLWKTSKDSYLIQQILLILDTYFHEAFSIERNIKRYFTTAPLIFP